MDTKWYFASAPGLEIEGLNNGDIESFKSAPARSLAREICQNSIDAIPDEMKAKRNRKEPITPARVEFSAFEGKVPCKGQLIQSMEEMSEYWALRQKKDKTVVKFLDGAVKLFKDDKVPFLRISDFNTTGLNGIGEIGTPWDNLVMSKGVSDKGGTDGGSKGIGHSAAIACSDARTVFYYTFNEDGKTAFEGASHLVGRGMVKDGAIVKDDKGWARTGYFGSGETGRTPVESMVDLGCSFERKDHGTDVYIAGFREDNWEEQIIRSSIDSFLMALYKKQLQLKVGDVEINSETLGSLIEKRSIISKAFKSHANQYYKVITTPSARKFEKQINEEGKRGTFVLRLLIDPSLDVRRVAMIRNNGMLIFEQGSLSSTIHFAGVIEVEGEELNAFLRSIENPQHTEWSSDRAPHGSKGKTEQFLDDLYHFCKESLLSMTQITPGEKVDSGLGSNESSGSSDDASDAEEQDVNDEFKPLKMTKSKRDTNPTNGKKKKRKKVKVESGSGDGTGGGSQAGASQGSGDNTGKNAGTTEGMDNDNFKWVDVEVSDLNYACVDKANSVYQVEFTPDHTYEKGEVKLIAMAEISAYKASISNAQLEDGSTLEIVDDGTIKGFKFEKNKKVSFSVKMDYADYCSLEVEAYGHN